MRRLIWLLASLAFMIALLTFAPQQSHGDGQGGHAGLYSFLFAMVVTLLAAKVGGELFETAGQPAVLGELVFGVILGNLYLFGLTGLQGLQHDAGLALAAEIGVILLLFEVGLETDLGELLEVGMTAFVVAILGVVVPVILGYGVSLYFLPEAAWYVHLFSGATLAATSVGITARVLKDINKMQTKEARIILGAAIVDDVLGLIILAVVSGIIKSIGAGGSSSIEIGPVLIIIGKAVLFLVVAVFAGRYIGGTLLRLGASAKVGGMPVVLSVCLCFALAGLAEFVGLAPIVGAFAAGLVLREEHYEGYEHLESEKFEEIVSPISAIFVPVFFVLMGFKVDLKLFTDLNVLTFAAGLSVAAIIGKQVCSLGVREKGLNRLAVGVGMIPRGEVGLIFAGIGSTLMVAGKPVFDAATFSSMVVMVMVTTLATPPILKYLFSWDK